MKVKCITDIHLDLIKGKIYTVQRIGKVGRTDMYSIVDESNDSYFYDPRNFEVVET